MVRDKVEANQVLRINHPLNRTKIGTSYLVSGKKRVTLLCEQVSNQEVSSNLVVRNM